MNFFVWARYQLTFWRDHVTGPASKNIRYACNERDVFMIWCGEARIWPEIAGQAERISGGGVGQSHFEPSVWDTGRNLGRTARAGLQLIKQALTPELLGPHKRIIAAVGGVERLIRRFRTEPIAHSVVFPA